MRAELFPIAECPIGRLAIMPRPRAGDWLEDEVDSWCNQGLDTVVSLLEDSEIVELGLNEEEGSCTKVGMRFVQFPISDRGVPSSASRFSQLVADLTAELQSGRSIGIHCRFGVGRSSSLAVCLMTQLGIDLESAWKAVGRARGMQVPDTPEQRAWVRNWCEKRHR